MFLKFASNRVFPEQAAAVLASAPAPAPAPASTLPAANHIIDGLYIGNLRLACQVLRSNDHMGVTHMLSLVSSSLLSSMCDTCVCPPASISYGDGKPSCPPASGDEKPSPAHFEVAKRGSSLVRMVVPLSDTPEEDILQVLEVCFKFIDEGRKHGTVLVHCMAGRSRSAAIVIAYLMRTLEVSVKQAMDMVNTHYKKALPNVGFMRQLEQFDQAVHNQSQMIRSLSNL